MPFLCVCVIHDVVVDEVITATLLIPTSAWCVCSYTAYTATRKIHQVIIDQVTLSWMALKK